MSRVGTSPNKHKSQQIREAFPWDQAPRYLIRDRDVIFGGAFVALTKSMGIEEVVTAPRSPWQNPYVERLIGSIRRECLDHVIVWNETSPRRILRSYFHYYQTSRTHLVSLGERHPGVERRRQTGERSYRCHCSGGRPAPSIRTARRLAVSRYHLCSVCALASTPPG